MIAKRANFSVYLVVDASELDPPRKCAMKVLSIVSSVILCFASFQQVCGQSPRVGGQTQPPIELEGHKTLYEQNFDELAGSLTDGNKHHGFWFEGADCGATAQFANRRLELNANDGKVGTLWLDHVFEGNIKIEFDVQVIASTGEKSNINFFLLFSDKTGTPLYDTRWDRSNGGYAKYHGGANGEHNLSGYVITHLANGTPKNPRYRLRSTPPFDPVLHEVTGVSDVVIGKTYHIEIKKIQDRIVYIVDGIQVFDATDDNTDGKDKPVRNSGLIGFRTWSTHLWWDNLKITRSSD